MLVPGRLRRRERELLDLVELVDADHAARVAAGRPGLAPEARREGDVAERELVGLQDLAGVEARERDLGRAGEVQAVGRQLVDVLLVGRERAGADQRLLAHEHGRQHADEALLGQAVEREAVQREREPGRVADPVAEARARHPRGPLHVEAAHLRVLARLAGALARRRAAPRRRPRPRPRRGRRRAGRSGRAGRAGRAPPPLPRAPPRPTSAPPSRPAAPRAARASACPSASSGRGARRRAGTSSRQRSSAASSASNVSAAPFRASAARYASRDRCGRP